MSSAVKATNRGPAWPAGTPAGSAAQVVSPQPWQTNRWRWYSVT
jgi:hypothetical protein